MRKDQLHPTQQTLVNAIQAEFDRVLADIGPRLDAHPDPAARKPENRNIQAAQNALRTCIEATYEKLVPYGETIPVELAIRLASYAISVLPAEAQAAATAAFLETFPTAHVRRLTQGIRIDSEWVTEGRVRPNFPASDS